MRVPRALFLSLVFASSGCSLLDDHCSGDVRVASSTLPLTGAALTQWNHSSCSTDEDVLCSHGLPLGEQLELCLHDSSVIATDGGAFMALRCHYTSTDKSCKSSSHDDD